jgi:hypothetical protein
MKNVKIMMLMAVLTLAWGCSGSDDSGNTEQWNGSTYASSAKPTWVVDWTSTSTKPDWQNPDATKFESSMHILVDVEGELKNNSSENDMMAAFIGGECRGVSHPTRAPNGSVSFLLYFKGTGTEGSVQTLCELRYYCDKLHHMNVLPFYIAFVPSNILDKKYMKVLTISEGSLKYPLCTQLTVMMPQKTPFTANSGDMLAVFVGDECRGVGARNDDAYGSWNVFTYGVKVGETAQIRYYSAEKGGVYTLLKTIELKGNAQQESITF